MMAVFIKEREAFVWRHQHCGAFEWRAHVELTLWSSTLGPLQ